MFHIGLQRENMKKSSFLKSQGTSTKFIKIYRHGLLAKISGIHNMSNVNSIIKDNTFESKIDLEK